MQVRRHDDSKPCARFDIDMRIDAALADESQPWETFQQRRGNRRPFADQDQRFSLLKSIGEEIVIVNVIVPDRDVMAVKLAKALERAKRVEIVVEDRNLHADQSTVLQTRRALKVFQRHLPGDAGRRQTERRAGILRPASRAVR